MDLDILIGIFPQVLLDGIILGFMYALIALGYTMVYGVLEFINFAHSEIFIIGAFVGVEIMLSFKAAGWLDVLVFDEQDRALGPELQALGIAPISTATMMTSHEAEVALARRVLEALGAA